MDKLKLLFATSRPVSWINTAYPFAMSYMLSGSSINISFIVSVLFFLIPYNLLMYGVNDVFDYESDIKNPRKGGVEGAITPKKYHKLILVSSLGLSAPFVTYMLTTGNMTSNLCLAGILFFVVAYSLKGLRFKEVPFLDSITSSIHFVGPLLYSFTIIGTVKTEAWLLALAFFLWGMASHAFGAVQDIKPDREANISSVATVLGAKNTVRFAAILYLLSAVIVGLQGQLLLLVGLVLLTYMLNIIPYWNSTDEVSDASNKAWKRFIKLNYAVGTLITVVALSVYTF